MARTHIVRIDLPVCQHVLAAFVPAVWVPSLRRVTRIG